jgi:hypothetical protein
VKHCAPLPAVEQDYTPSEPPAFPVPAAVEVAPAPSVNEPDLEWETEARRRKRRMLMGTLAGFGVLTTLLVMFMFLVLRGGPDTKQEKAGGHQPGSLPGAEGKSLPAGPPATCRQVAERLQAKGMNVDWINCMHKYPAIYVFSRKRMRVSDDIVINVLFLDGQVQFGQWSGIVVVVQYPTAGEAEEQAGIKHDAFAWGRFMIFGDGTMVQEIRARL